MLASLCCLSPIILLSLGIGTTAFAASLADTLYGDYKWVFRIVGLIALAISHLFYFRKKGVCTLDQAKKRRHEIMNTILIVFIVSVLGYIVWLYGVIEIIGIWMGIWG